MTPQTDARSEKERYYDEHIAPKLQALALDCQSRGLSLLALCEFEPGKSGQTRAYQDDASFSMKLADVAARAQGNVDSLLIALLSHARQHGHNSLLLQQLLEPSPEKA